MKSIKNKTHLHVHVTVEEFPDITPKGWKQTIIRLGKNGRFQTDKMLTKHFYINNEQSFEQTILTSISFLPLDKENIIRVKIEQESNLPKEIPFGKYLEIHAETLEGYRVGDWVFSENPERPDTIFLNNRYYTGNIEEILSSVDRIKRIMHDFDYRSELVIYDSNHEHDSWWA